MLQASDIAPLDKETHSGRAEWIAMLARAPIDLLEPISVDAAHFDQHFLRPPETGLMMIQGRAGGTGARFNLGEVTVTRCAVRLRASEATQTVGIAYVLGRSRRKAHLAALGDALLQMPDLYSMLDSSLLEPLRRHQAAEAAELCARAASTRVDFFTVAREAGPVGSTVSAA